MFHRVPGNLPATIQKVIVVQAGLASEERRLQIR
jgi:hypothetical protein